MGFVNCNFNKTRPRALPSFIFTSKYYPIMQVK